MSPASPPRPRTSPLSDGSGVAELVDRIAEHRAFLERSGTWRQRRTDSARRQVRPEDVHVGVDVLPVVIRYATRRGNQRGLHNLRFAVCDGNAAMCANSTSMTWERLAGAIRSGHKHARNN